MDKELKAGKWVAFPLSTHVQPVPVPNPHNYHVLDATVHCPADKRFIGDFRDLCAAREFALQMIEFHGGKFTVVKGEYVK